MLANEFEAWGEGERVLLARADFVPTTPHLLVSLGTGTSILRVGQDGRVARAGGTGLGGGTCAQLSASSSARSTTTRSRRSRDRATGGASTFSSRTSTSLERSRSRAT